MTQAVRAEDYGVLVLPIPEEDGGGYIALVVDLPGCASDGETQEEAISNVRGAIDDWIETAVELDRNIPEPGSAVEAQRKRMTALQEAFKVLSDFAVEADAKATLLEERLAQFVALLKDQNGRLPAEYALLGAEDSSNTKIH